MGRIGRAPTVRSRCGEGLLKCPSHSRTDPGDRRRILLKHRKQARDPSPLQQFADVRRGSHEANSSTSFAGSGIKNDQFTKASAVDTGDPSHIQNQSGNRPLREQGGDGAGEGRQPGPQSQSTGHANRHGVCLGIIRVFKRHAVSSAPPEARDYGPAAADNWDADRGFSPLLYSHLPPGCRRAECSPSWPPSRTIQTRRVAPPEPPRARCPADPKAGPTGLLPRLRRAPWRSAVPSHCPASRSSRCSAAPRRRTRARAGRTARRNSAENGSPGWPNPPCVPAVAEYVTRPRSAGETGPLEIVPPAPTHRDRGWSRLPREYLPVADASPPPARTPVPEAHATTWPAIPAQVHRLHRGTRCRLRPSLSFLFSKPPHP